MKRALQKLEGPQRLLPRFEGEQAWTSRQHVSPLRTSPSILHGWLKISGSPKYLRYDWVDHRWQGVPNIKC